MPATLSDLPLEQLLTHLGERRATGTLSLTVPHARKKLYLLDGLLGGVSSTSPRDLLGHFLVGWGLVSEEQVAEAMRLQEQLGTPLGRILERMGAIDPQALEEALIAQCDEAVLDLFLAPRVDEQQWAENIVPIDRPLVLRRPLATLALEGLRRRHQYLQISAVLESTEVVPKRLASPLPDNLAPRERLILAAMDGQRTVEDIAFTCHVVPFHVLELTYRGLQEGFVAVRGSRSAQTTPSPASPVARGRAALAEGNLLAAWQAVRSQGSSAERAGTLPEGAAILREVEALLAPLRACGQLIPRTAKTNPTLPAAVGAAGAFVLSRVNNRWSLRQIQRVTPLEETHFWAIVHTLLRAEVIQLGSPDKGVVSVTR